MIRANAYNGLVTAAKSLARVDQVGGIITEKAAGSPMHAHDVIEDRLCQCCRFTIAKGNANCVACEKIDAGENV